MTSLQTTLVEVESKMAVLAPHRDPSLFRKFLPEGYRHLTLSSVPSTSLADLIEAKLCLGTLITLLDDFADRPSQRDPGVLEAASRMSFGSSREIKAPRSLNSPVLLYARALIAKIDTLLRAQPHYDRLLGVLNFDLKQIHLANEFSALSVDDLGFVSPHENRLYSHHNMGLVAAATMDLMASEKTNFEDFAAMRETFLCGQRIGRICNVLATTERERTDGDLTGELSHLTSTVTFKMAERRLRREIPALRKRIRTLAPKIRTFSADAYLDGLSKVADLHETMTGVI